MKNENISIERGQIWYVSASDTTSTGSEIWSNRPALIVSNDGTNQKADFVNIVYLTTQNKKRMPYHVPIKSGSKDAIALCEQVFPADKSRLVNLMGKATSDEMDRVDSALIFSLGINAKMGNNEFFQKWVNYINRYKLDLSGNPGVDDNDENNGLYKKLYLDAVQTIESLNNVVATQNMILNKEIAASQ